MKWIEDAVVERIEKDSPQGLTSAQILGFFATNGISLSEASLRKYVQLGLLPRSVRIGQKGKHRGSKGVYPVRVVRQILLIKKMMGRSYTIEQIQKQFLFLRGELDDLEECLSGIFEKLTERSVEVSNPEEGGVAREVRAAHTVGRDLIMRLRTLESRFAAEGESADNEGARVVEVAS